MLVVLLCLVGCEAAKSANPLAPSSTAKTDIAAVSQPTVVVPARIDAPIAMAPSGRLNNNNPDFFVKNGVIEGASDVTYFFEVSATPDFSQIAAIVTAPVNATGSTLMSLGSLAYGGTYYWRAKGTDGSTESDYSNTLSFTLPSGPYAAASSDPVASIEFASWSNEQWRAYFFSLVEQKGGATVSDSGMRAMRSDLLRAARISRTAGAATCGRGCSCRFPVARSPTGPMFRSAHTAALWILGTTAGRGSGSSGSNCRGVKP